MIIHTSEHCVKIQSDSSGKTISTVPGIYGNTYHIPDIHINTPYISITSYY